MSQRYDLKFQLQYLSSCRLNIEKIDFSIVIKFFCDVINVEVRYFQITFKFDIFRFFLFSKLQHFVLSAKDREKHKKKNDEKKFFKQKSRSSVFSNHGRAVLGTTNLHCISQPQTSQNSNGWSATANPQVCGTFAEFFSLSQPQMTFYFRKLEPQTLLLSFSGLINRKDL